MKPTSARTLVRAVLWKIPMLEAAAASAGVTARLKVIVEHEVWVTVTVNACAIWT